MPSAPCRPCALAAIVCLPLSLYGAGAVAQTQVLACENQQSLEQHIGSQGDIVPDDCRPVSVTRLQSDVGELCLIEFGEGEGFLDELRDLAVTREWWVHCEGIFAEPPL